MQNKINSYSELFDLVENDKKDHPIKEMAQLFLSAMLDWPNQNSISDFVLELKSYFGNPLTIDNISKKEFHSNYAWQMEAGSSIVELFKIAEKEYQLRSFDQILEQILSYYNFET